MHKPEPVFENDTRKIHWNFGIQTDQLILARKPGLVLITKKKEKKNYRIYISLILDKSTENT